MTDFTSCNSLTGQNPPHTKHCVIILAAGQSRRLGQPKQLLKIQGQLLLRHMAQLALATEATGVSVVIPQSHPDISATLDGLAVNTICNPTPEIGMALSLSLGIDVFQAQFAKTVNLPPQDPPILIMGVDQVRLTSAHLQQLLTQYHACENTLVSASQYAGIIGLPLVIRWSQLLAWQPQLTGDKGLRKFIRALPESSYSTLHFPNLAEDIDTAEQYAAARRLDWLD